MAPATSPSNAVFTQSRPWSKVLRTMAPQVAESSGAAISTARFHAVPGSVAHASGIVPSPRRSRTTAIARPTIVRLDCRHSRCRSSSSFAVFRCCWSTRLFTSDLADVSCQSAAIAETSS